MKTKLTIAKIETAKVPSGQTETKLWDSLVNGLYLRISASGGRRWYFRYRNDHGKVRPLKVGDYPALSIDVVDAVVQVVDHDPFEAGIGAESRPLAGIRRIRPAAAHRRGSTPARPRAPARAARGRAAPPLSRPALRPSVAWPS